MLWLNKKVLDPINFNIAFLEGSDFTDANLAESTFDLADLQYTNFTKANLKMADLARADLTGADLTETNLNGANLVGAILTAAKLFKTDFKFARLDRGNIVDVLKQRDGVENLETTEIWCDDLNKHLPFPEFMKYNKFE